MPVEVLPTYLLT